MEFNEKLQELRKQKGLTQEELAEQLYVSRTAISKWESGRGYPNIESLKAIAQFFSITLDELLSANEALTVAEEEHKRKEKSLRDLVYGLLDLCAAMLFFLPLFAVRTGDAAQSVSLLALTDVRLYVKIVWFAVVIAICLMGIVTLALQNCEAKAWLKSKTVLSSVLGACAVLLFVITAQPYVAVFSFVLLMIKMLLLIKRQ